MSPDVREGRQIMFPRQEAGHQESLHVERLNHGLPFGRGKAYLKKSGWTDMVVDGWSTSLTVAARSGTAFTVLAIISTSAGGDARAIMIGDPLLLADRRILPIPGSRAPRRKQGLLV
jgi:hypothetical protein